MYYCTAQIGQSLLAIGQLSLHRTNRWLIIGNRSIIIVNYYCSAQIGQLFAFKGRWRLEHEHKLSRREFKGSWCSKSKSGNPSAGGVVGGRHYNQLLSDFSFFLYFLGKLPSEHFIFSQLKIENRDIRPYVTISIRFVGSQVGLTWNILSSALKTYIINQDWRTRTGF